MDYGGLIGRLPSYKMNKNIQFDEEQIAAVNLHNENTAKHNAQFTCMSNEGKLGHRDWGVSDWEGKVLIKCPVTGIESLHWVILQESAYRSGKRFMQVTARPYNVDAEPYEYKPQEAPAKPAPKKKKPTARKAYSTSTKKEGGR